MANLKAVNMTVSDYEDHTDSNDGVCLGCGAINYGGLEPDARGVECEVCGEPKAYGVEEALLMGFIIIDEDEPEEEE